MIVTGWSSELKKEEEESYELYNMLSLHSLVDMIYNEISSLKLKIKPIICQDIFQKHCEEMNACN